MPETGRKLGQARLRTALAILVIATIAWFLGHAIVSQWDAVQVHDWRMHAGWLVLSGLSAWCVIVVLILLWRFLLHRLARQSLGFGDAFRITVLANLGKYIPGKVWSVLGVIYMLRQQGFAAGTAFGATVLHQAFTIISGILFVGAILGRQVFGDLTALPIIVAAALAAIVVYPPIFGWMLNFGLRLFKREPVEVGLGFPVAVGLLTVYCGIWVGYGAAFWTLLEGVGLPELPFWETGAIFAAAYLLGFLMLFAPGGLGVREGVIALLLTPQLGEGLAAAVAVVARLWMTLVELLGLIPAIILLRNSRVTGE